MASENVLIVVKIRDTVHCLHFIGLLPFYQCCCRASDFRYHSFRFWTLVTILLATIFYFFRTSSSGVKFSTLNYVFQNLDSNRRAFWISRRAISSVHVDVFVGFSCLCHHTKPPCFFPNVSRVSSYGI